jgi:uncharacterized membrane protein
MHGQQNIILIYYYARPAKIILIYYDARSAKHYTDIVWRTVSKTYWYTMVHAQQIIILIYYDARSAKHYTDIL